MWQCAFFPAPKWPSRRRWSATMLSTAFCRACGSASLETKWPGSASSTWTVPSRCPGVPRRADRAGHPPMRRPARNRAAVASVRARRQRSAGAGARFSRRVTRVAARVDRLHLRLGPLGVPSGPLLLFVGTGTCCEMLTVVDVSGVACLTEIWPGSLQRRGRLGLTQTYLQGKGEPRWLS